MGKIKEQVAQLLDQEMDRTQFLQYAGVVMLAFLGISGLIQTLLGTHKSEPKQSGHGYGSSRYNR